MWDILDKEIFSDDEQANLRPFDFETHFKRGDDGGCFDVVIGNPPYVQLSMKQFRDDRVNRYLPWKYGISGGRLNTFAFFLERARDLCHLDGIFAYIVPNTVTTQEYYGPLRSNLLHGTEINYITTPVGNVFKDAVVETVILVAKKVVNSTTVPQSKVKFEILDEEEVVSLRAESPQVAFLANNKLSFIASGNPAIDAIKSLMLSQDFTFGEFTEINQAIALNKGGRAKALVQSQKSVLYHEILDGRHIDRYYVGVSPTFFKFDASVIHSCKREDIFQEPEKIFFRRVGERLMGALDTEKKYALNTLVVITPKPDCPYEIRFLLGLFNSKLLNFYYFNFLKSLKKTFSEIQARQVAQLPLPRLNLGLKVDSDMHNHIVAKVEILIATTKRLHLPARTEQERSLAEAKCASIEREIDQAIYKLYKLTPAQINLVESLD